MGLLITTVFVSSNGFLSGLSLAVLIAAMTCLVSFCYASIVRTLPLAVVASAVTTDLVFLIYFMSQIAWGPHDSHAVEAYLLIPILFVLVTAPGVGASSLGFGRIAHRNFADPTSSDELDQPSSDDAISSTNQSSPTD